jgi:hypothetical protein
VSFEDASWRAILVSDETGPVGAVCYSEPSIYPQITVDAVVLHPERAGNVAQVAALLEACLPILRQVALRFKAQRIVFETVPPTLRGVLDGYGAREDSITLSIPAIEVAVPKPPTISVGIFDEPETVVIHKSAAVGTTEEMMAKIIAPETVARCGRQLLSKAGRVGHERHCQKCKEA